MDIGSVVDLARCPKFDMEGSRRVGIETLGIPALP
jgi:hypothetical protein